MVIRVSNHPHNEARNRAAGLCICGHHRALHEWPRENGQMQSGPCRERHAESNYGSYVYCRCVEFVAAP